MEQFTDDSMKITAAYIPRCSVFRHGKKHLDDVPLMLDADAETQLLETLPPLKLLMTLQVNSLSATFTRMWYRINGWQGDFGACFPDVLPHGGLHSLHL